MIDKISVIAMVPTLAMVSLILIPSRVADKWAATLRQSIPWLLGIQALLALTSVALLAVAKLSGNDFTKELTFFKNSAGVGVGAIFDGVSSLMLAMVSIVGFTVAKYSIRYLDGEAMQGRYFRWLGFTTGSVSLMVISGNLLLFFIAWVMTSFGLHQLLLHYRHRKEAHRAAWTKFAISRLGDAFLIAAFSLLYVAFGTLDMATLFDKASTISGANETTYLHAAIGWLIVLGAATKSAQFPCHIWLPNTMETPTPVSALMHAGIVNAGGYLVIRMSPILALAPEALLALAALGAFTACFGGVIMMTQPSIKRALAYSTIAQMGFMMLQCGLGAFSAALLHILAHSFYKAHAFLTTGSVIEKSTAPQANPLVGRQFSSVAFICAAVIAILGFGMAATVLGYQTSDKPGGAMLAFLLCLAVTTWGWRLLAARDKTTIAIAAAGLCGLSMAYVASYSGVAFLVGSSVPSMVASPMLQVLVFDVALAFGLLLIVHLIVFRQKAPVWLESLRIHASNGFYVDALAKRWLGALVRS